jgi:hypothetical protein
MLSHLNKASPESLISTSLKSKNAKRQKKYKINGQQGIPF